jgi:hypothetical protein
LLIAAGQGLDRRVDIGRSNAEPRDPVASQLAPATGRDESEGVSRSVQDSNRHIVGDRLFEIEAERQSIFGYVGDSSSHSVLVRAKIERRSVNQDFATLEHRHPKKSQRELGPARPQESDQAEDLAATKHKRHIFEFARA